MNKYITINIILALIFSINISSGQTYNTKKYFKFDSIKATLSILSENDIVSAKIDTQSILSRAKLLTTEKSGVMNSNIVVADVLTQKTEVYYAENQLDVLYIFINHGQKYYHDYSNGKIDYEHYSVGCVFLIVYNSIDNKFYKISGFEASEFDDFKHDIKKHLPSQTHKTRKILNQLKKASDCNCEYNESNRIYVY